jgi:site-specific recombinase XerD
MANPLQGVDTHLHFLTPGCLEPYLNNFTAELTSAGYKTLTISNYWQSIAHFGTWMQYECFGVYDIDAQVVAAFGDHRCHCPGGRRNKKLSRRYVARVWRFVHYLNQHGVIDMPQKKTEDTPPASVVDFGQWLLRYRGIATRTVERYQRAIVSLLPLLGDDPARYNAATIRQALTSKAIHYRPAAAKDFVTALRAYLRFLTSQGRCRAGLEVAVPAVPQWKLSALPRYLPADDVERMIASCDEDPRGGLRNRAVLLLLARLGLRAGDIVNLRLEDIDWNEGTLRVLGKGRREVRLPLPQDAGDALLTYLDQARPRVAIDRVFLCLSAPYRAFPSSVVVSDIVRSALARAGITNPPSRGANLLRHSAATSMLRAGATLDAVSTVLRHRSLDTTAHYAKVDIAMLQPIAQPWPGGAPC